MKKVLMLILGCFFFGCDVDTPSDKTPEEEGEGAIIDEVSRTVATSILADRHGIVKIAKGLLDRPLWLSVAEISGLPFPMGSSHPLVQVEFKLESGLSLYQRPDGLAGGVGVTAKTLLATFPLLSENSTSLAVDFTQGVSRLLEGAFATENGISRDLLSLSIESSEANDQRILVRANAAVRINGGESSDEDDGVKSRFFVSFFPYSENPSFKPLDMSSLPQDEISYDDGDVSYLKRVGYFTTESFAKGDGILRPYALRWDMNKPITFHLSANIPKAYQEAIADGVLYWNDAFGKEVVKVASLTDNTSPHSPNMNVIQWVDWDDLGFAYADMAHNPVTGEILQGQIYIASAFGFATRMEAIARLAKASKPHAKGHRLVCFERSLPTMSKLLLPLVSDPDIPDDAFLRFSKDLILSTTAHEVGHVLGLTHNFAAKVNAKINPSNIAEKLKNYAKKDAVDKTKFTATSVMDYIEDHYAVLQGAQIRKYKKAFAYDQAAIDYGYLGKKWWKTSFGPFCPDEAADTEIFDCNLFGPPGAAIVSHWQKVKQMGGELAASFLGGFLAAKGTQGAYSKIPIEEIPLSPDSTLSQYVDAVTSAMLAVTQDAASRYSRFIAIEHKSNQTHALNMDARRKSYKGMHQDALEALSGYATIFGYITPVKSGDNYLLPGFKAFLAEVKDTVASKAFRTYIDATGKEITFTEDDVAYITKTATTYATKLSKSALGDILDLLQFGDERDFPTGDSEALAEAVNDLVKVVIEAEKEESITETIEEVEVTVAKPYFSLSMRENALNLLASSYMDLFPDDFNPDGVDELRDVINQKLNQILDPDGDESLVSSDDLGDDMRLIATELEYLVAVLDNL